MGRVGGNFGSFVVLVVLDVNLILLLDYIVCFREIGMSSKFDSEFWVVESFCIVNRVLVNDEFMLDVGYNSLFIYVNI